MNFFFSVYISIVVFDCRRRWFVGQIGFRWLTTIFLFKWNKKIELKLFTEVASVRALLLLLLLLRDGEVDRVATLIIVVDDDESTIDDKLTDFLANSKQNKTNKWVDNKIVFFFVLRGESSFIVVVESLTSNKLLFGNPSNTTESVCCGCCWLKIKKDLSNTFFEQKTIDIYRWLLDCCCWIRLIARCNECQAPTNVNDEF